MKLRREFHEQDYLPARRQKRLDTLLMVGTLLLAAGLWILVFLTFNLLGWTVD